jgi:hypothetical protein
MILKKPECSSELKSGDVIFDTSQLQMIIKLLILSLAMLDLKFTNSNASVTETVESNVTGEEETSISKLYVI